MSQYEIAALREELQTALSRLAAAPGDTASFAAIERFKDKLDVLLGRITQDEYKRRNSISFTDPIV